jgi:hypothetical protein
MLFMIISYGFFKVLFYVLEVDCMLLVRAKFEICVCCNFVVGKWGHKMDFFCFDLVMWLKSHKLYCIVGYLLKNVCDLVMLMVSCMLLN